MNWFLGNSKYALHGVTSTGRDGEEIDLLTAKKKPKVELPSGTLFTSFDYIAEQSPHQLKVMEKLPFRVIGKNIWLYRALGKIETEIVGPITLNEQIELINIFKNNKCDCVLIDGSIDRKSICLTDKISEIVLVIGAAAGKLAEICTQTEIIKMYSMIKTKKVKEYEFITYKSNKIINTEIKSIYSNEDLISNILENQPDWIYFPGMLTSNSWQKFKNNLKCFKGDIIFNHPINLNISLHELEFLLRNNRVFVRLSFPVKTVAINSFSPNNDHIDVNVLKEKISQIFNNLKIIDVRGIL